MRKIAVLFLLTSVFISLSAQETVYENPVSPMIPEIIAQGGSFTAVAEGYPALFTNPAGFAADRTDFTIVTANPWVYARPDKLIETVGIMTGAGGPDTSVIIDAVEDQIINNGFGVGAAFGISYVGSGLGLGLFGVVDFMLSGDSIPGVEGELEVTVGAVGGYAIPFELGGLVLTIGGDVRPMVRLRAPLKNSVALGLVSELVSGNIDVLPMLMGLDAYYGSALAVDLGALLDIGPFSIGLSVRDLGGTQFFYSSATVAQQLDSIQSGAFPQGNITDTEFIIPMEISLGAAFHPDLGDFSDIIDPQVHIDLKDPIGVIRDGKSPWMLLHIGGEVRFFNFINVRAGLNQGFLTLGLGFDIPFMNINIATFSRASGIYLLDGQTSGVSIEAAIRF